MASNNMNNSINPYPVEQDFKFPFVITALFVLLPGLALYWFLGDSSSVPRAFKLFFGNWISPIILWFFVASFFHLWLKRSRLKKEVAQTSLVGKRVFPTSMNDFSVPEEALYKRIKMCSNKQGIDQHNLLLTRLALFLNHDDDDIDDMFAIKEREQMKGSFSLPRFMVWAIPILGFIGTVWGISNGIAHFSDAMTSTNSVTDVSAMLKENLPLVTNSLATAFDTTLLALLLSIPLMMLMLAQEKSEEAYLIDLDETWFHEVKPTLKTKTTNQFGYSSSEKTGMIQESVVSTSGQDTQVIANEIKTLSTQIKALQETMEDLYETVFASKLGSKE